MRSIKVNTSKVFSFLLVLLGAIFSALLLGQVLGSLYLSNITQGEHWETVNRSVSSRGSSVYSGTSSKDRVNNKKKKVLRLKSVDYYTVLVATVEKRQEAMDIGNELGQKGLPAIVTGEGPYRVLLGFTNNRESLVSLAERIKVGDMGADVICEKLNKVAYKFKADDTIAVQTIAPFLGKTSICLQKGIFLYQGIALANAEISPLRSKFKLLAKSLEEVANEGLKIKDEIENEDEGRTDFSSRLFKLSLLSQEWVRSIHSLETDFSETNLLKTQQQGLALLEEYHSFIRDSNRL